MSFSITILPRAEADTRRFYHYIKKRSPLGAQRWRGSLDSGLLRISTQPFSCGLAPESEMVTEELRQLLFGTRSGRIYRAIFLVEGQDVVVLRVRGSGQKTLSKREMR